VVYQLVNGRKPGGTGQGVAAKGGGVISRHKGCGHLFPCHHGSDGKTAAQGLGQSKYVGLHPVVLVRQEFTRSTQSALHLVKYQKQSLLAAKIPYLTQIPGVCLVYPSFSLNRLKHHCAGVGGHRLVKGGHIVEGHVAKALGEGLKTLLVLGLARCGDGGQSPTVKGI